ncbi:hypothetical protein GCM10010492_21880 [Saccharothrix mutabilis subsp. mutabilis]|uniref:Uncharacterized protein n=1 Tax=Saccharothrix mutabilis subsp. mutabilis TaxID=66855 RepID=A0ABN0TJM0_9PSEU
MRLVRPPPTPALTARHKPGARGAPARFARPPRARSARGGTARLRRPCRPPQAAPPKAGCSWGFAGAAWRGRRAGKRIPRLHIATLTAPHRKPRRRPPSTPPTAANLRQPPLTPADLHHPRQPPPPSTNRRNQ